MASIRMRYDGVESTLKYELDNVADFTTVNFETPLTHAGDQQVPSLNQDEYIPMSILDANYRLMEIVWLTAYDSSAPLQGTILRAQELTGLHTHPATRKIVHAPTVMDFTLLQDHNNDPNAHANLVQMLKDYTDSQIAKHNADPLAHSYLARKHDPAFTGVATFEDIEVGSDLIIKSGAIVTVDPGGQVIINGTITINGKRLHISNTAPTTPPPIPPNLVWIKTFG